MMKYKIGFIIIGVLSISCGTKVNSPPNVPSTPIGERYGYIDSSYNFFTSATDPDGDNISIRFSWDDGDTSVWSPYIFSGDTITMAHSFNDTGRYNIIAQAKDEDEALSNWSGYHSVRILLLGENNYPDPPANPSGPNTGKVDSVYSFFTSAYDPDGDSIAIRFSWGDGDTSVWSPYVANNQVVRDSHIWRSAGNYYIRAQAKDIHNSLSPWSGIHSISIVINYKPNKPTTPVGPSTGWVDSLYTFSSSTTDPDGDSIAFRFSWGDGDTSVWSPYVKSGDTISMSHSWQNPGTYYIKAQAKDKKGAFSEWSNSKKLLISSITNQPPNKPSKPSGPEIGHVDSIYFYFSSAVDPNGDSIAIRFDWGDGNISQWSNYFASGSVIGLSHSWNYPGFYYISAQAKDKKGAFSGWSDSLVIRIYW